MQVLKDEIRKQILEAAEQLFVEHGFVGTTTRMIANRVGISVSHLYLYYENKEALYCAITDPFIQYFTQSFEQFLNHEKEFDHMGTQLSQMAFELIMSNRNRLLLVLEKSKGSKYENFKLKIIEELKEHIQSQMNSKIHNKELLAHVFAKGLIEGIIVIAHEYRDTEQLKHNLECMMNYHADGIKSFIYN